ncbi:DUF938 domain-containing protein [Acetobacteraceae bacterium H6797]|nr:DUF938 domain-containing protein [Acetobacteraceae bacterium H6797]
MPAGAKRTAPSAGRNRGPILDVMRPWLPERGLVLEIASGSGEHAVFFAEALPGLVFQPTDPEPAAIASIGAWAAETGLPNICPPLALDVTQAEWPVAEADAVICINMIHIAPWDATLGLLDGASRLLSSGRSLCLYGPYRQAGVSFAPSNQAFDEDLRRRNPAWGIRQLETVAHEAELRGFRLEAVQPMPANNLCVRFVRD